MNVTDRWMLEQMQQMAAAMAASLPKTVQNTDAKPEKGESFQDMMNKVQDKKTEAPKKDAVQKEEPVQSKEPVEEGTFLVSVPSAFLVTSTFRPSSTGSLLWTGSSF